MKKLRIILFVTVSLCVLFSAAPASALSAQAPSQWAQSDVTKAISGGFVPLELQSAYGDNITRSEFCKLTVTCVAVRLSLTVNELIAKWCSEKFDQNGVHPSYRENVFTDSNDFYVNCAFLLNIARGCGDGTFNPSGLITRQEAAAMLFGAFAAYGGGIMMNQRMAYFYENYTDIGMIADWALVDVAYIFELGVMNGVSENTFAPLSYFTREQAIVAALRLCTI
jgi:hypothetical protein